MRLNINCILKIIIHVHNEYFMRLTYYLNCIPIILIGNYFMMNNKV